MFVRAAFVPILMLVLGGCERYAPGKKSEHTLDIGTSSIATPELWRASGTLECRAVRKDVCGSDGCATSAVKTFIRLNPSTGVYQRCDHAGCDSYSATVAYSGVWTTLILPQNASFARLTSSLDFVEVATSNDVTYLYRGKCKKLHP